GLIPDDDTKEGNWHDTRIGVVEYDGKKGISTLFAPIGETNTGDKKTLADFIKDCNNLYPAEHYMLIISGHGNPFKGMAHDNEKDTKDLLSPAELRNAIHEAGVNIDILFANVCMGASVEWVSALPSDKVVYYIAAETTTKAVNTLRREFGDRLQTILKASSGSENEVWEVAKAALQTWSTGLPDAWWDPIDMSGRWYSLIRVKQHIEVKQALMDFKNKAMDLSLSDKRTLYTIAEQTPLIKFVHKDLLLFMERIRDGFLVVGRPTSEAVIEFCESTLKVENAVRNLVPLSLGNRTASWWGCRGISIATGLHKDYKAEAITFEDGSNWLDFIKSISNTSGKSIHHQTLTDDLPDTAEQAKIVSMMQSSRAIFTSFIDHAGDVDAMEIQAQAGQALHVRLGSDLADGVILQIYGPQGQSLLGQAETDPGQEAVVQIDAVLEETTYICVISTKTLSIEDGQTNDWLVTYSLEVIMAEADRLVSTLEIASGSIDFGAVQINSTPGPQSIEIHNSGLLPVEITDITMTDGGLFKLVPYFPLPMRIEPNFVGEIIVEFYPLIASDEPYTEIMTLVTSDPEQPFVVLTLTGLGVDEPDEIAPESSAWAWTADPSGPSIVVSWSGWDGIGGSGIAWYDVYVSVDGGEYTLWQFRTTKTSAVFPGQSGHTYAFYSIATDKAGNVEPVPTELDTLIVVPELSADAS
ncbi:clostripain-related cysteine peptidase, partial [Planctomycetota bacterium]